LPKPLVEVGGQTLLARQAAAMSEAGADPVLAFVNSETARLIEQRRVELPSALKLNVRDTRNSIETLCAIGEQLFTVRFVLATVDAILPRSEFIRFVSAARQLTAPDRAGALDGVLGVVRWRGDRRPLFAEIADDGLITALGNRETPLVTAGIYLFSTAIFRFVGRAAGLSAMRDYLGYLVKKGMCLGAIEVTGAIDVDEPQDLGAARAMLRRERAAARTG
jgi:NDP-sugar pyrophosphorylase family protein